MTPEAVVLDMPEATVGSRSVAMIVDLLLQLLAYTLVIVAVRATLTTPLLPSWAPISLSLITLFLVLFGYPTAFETAWRGRTPGKALMGLRVVTVEGAPVRFRHAAIRAGLGLIDFWMTLGFAAVASSMVSRRNQRLGDFVAGTVVRRERTGVDTTTAQQFTMPDDAHGLADGIDTTALRPRDYAAIRTFLIRVDDLSPDRRDAIGRQLLDALDGRLAGVPDHLPPRTALQSIAASYQQRHRAHSDGLTSTP